MRSRWRVAFLPVPLVLEAATAGAALGLGAYAFHYAKGSSYFGNNPASCANCHVMSSHYEAWLSGPHHGAATCNDCHTPAGPVSRYAVKAANGWHHSVAFTLGDVPDVIRARPQSTAVEAGEPPPTSMGFHAPQEMARILGGAIDLSRQAEVNSTALLGGRLPAPVLAVAEKEEKRPVR